MEYSVIPERMFENSSEAQQQTVRDNNILYVNFKWAELRWRRSREQPSVINFMFENVSVANERRLQPYHYIRIYGGVSDFVIY